VTYQRALRGRGWQRGHVYAERFVNASHRMGVPHRGHGSLSRPYTASAREKYPDCNSAGR
jgi:hypothetical protein